MFRNIKEGREIQEQVRAIRMQIDKLARGKDQIEQFGEKKINLLKNLANTMSFLEA